MENNNEYPRNKAYQIGLKFKNSKLDEEVIYAKLEKQGIPVDLAKEVAMNVIIERNKSIKEDLSDYKNIVNVMIVIWVLAAIIAYIFTQRISVVVNLLIVGVPTTIIVYLMTTNKKCW